MSALSSATSSRGRPLADDWPGNPVGTAPPADSRCLREPLSGIRQIPSLGLREEGVDVTRSDRAALGRLRRRLSPWQPDRERRPRPRADSTSTVPPMSSVSCFTMARPMPAPSCDRAFPGRGSCSKRSKTRLRSRLRMPIPVSLTDTAKPSASHASRKVTVPDGVYFSALPSRLSTMRSYMSRSRYAGAAALVALRDELQPGAAEGVGEGLGHGARLDRRRRGARRAVNLARGHAPEVEHRIDHSGQAHGVAVDQLEPLALVVGQARVGQRRQRSDR